MERLCKEIAPETLQMFRNENSDNDDDNDNNSTQKQDKFYHWIMTYLLKQDQHLTAIIRTQQEQQKNFAAVTQCLLHHSDEIVKMMQIQQEHVNYFRRLSDQIVEQQKQLTQIIERQQQQEATNSNLLQTQSSKEQSATNIDHDRACPDKHESRKDLTITYDQGQSYAVENSLQHHIEIPPTEIEKKEFEFSDTMIPNIPVNARWAQNGVTVAGGNGEGHDTNQLSQPLGLFVDEDETVIITDNWNHRIVEWKKNDTNGRVIAGGNGQGNRLNQLKYPSDVLFDKDTKNLIICDRGNERVVQWSRRSGTSKGKVLIDKIFCYGLAMDDQKYLYVTDIAQNAVRRYKIGEKNGTLVAGGHGAGDGLNQFDEPIKIFVDQQQAVYISDNRNHRVMKWNKGATAGIVVAGGQGQGDALTQLFTPIGLVVDALGTVYVADTWNSRVVSWPKGAKQGNIIAGGNGEGKQPNQLQYPVDLSFDRHGNLYVVDWDNSRVQRFSIK
ncbi:unnamed protein product [Rotaria sp. Silwood1]|nr:unnamed protein product [Rotaria sp. Silwood1]